MTEMMGDDVFGGHGRIKQLGLGGYSKLKPKTSSSNFKV